MSSTNFRLTFSQPSGGSLARNLLMCGEVPSLPVSWSGDDPLLPPVYIKYVTKQRLNNTVWSPLEDRKILNCDKLFSLCSGVGVLSSGDLTQSLKLMYLINLCDDQTFAWQQDFQKCLTN